MSQKCSVGGTFYWVFVFRDCPKCFCCVPLSVDISLQHFLCFSCRVPADVGGSLKPGAFPTFQPGSKEMKGEPESPLMGSPTPSPDSPARSSCQPNSPAESNTCSKNLVVSSKKIQQSFVSFG